MSAKTVKIHDCTRAIERVHTTYHLVIAGVANRLLLQQRERSRTGSKEYPGQVYPKHFKMRSVLHIGWDFNTFGLIHSASFRMITWTGNGNLLKWRLYIKIHFSQSLPLVLQTVTAAASRRGLRQVRLR